MADVQVVLSCESGFVGDDTTDSEGVFEISGVPADDTCSLQVNGLTATVVETSPNSVININVTISPSGIAGDDTVVVGGTIEDNTGEDIVEEPSKKVTLCHKGKNTISVGAPAKPAHLAHGDTEGPCTEDVPPAEGEPQVTEQGSGTGDGGGTGV